MNNSKYLSSFSKSFLWTLSSSISFNTILSVIYLSWSHNNQMQNALDLFSFADKSQLMKGYLCLARKGKTQWKALSIISIQTFPELGSEYSRTSGMVRTMQGWHVWILNIRDDKINQVVCVLEDIMVTSSLCAVSFPWSSYTYGIE
jgi:hypothetical protein